ncbi:flagellar biosynthesis protein FlhF [Teredinibacter waterburyi]|jgi:flagellar biosynthetic protein FlhF|uniref:flagellar biosynthesis protein FlhF n=1 Tax=Teredinibacter waterburyi TaxID=1500538 RepID=UPI00166000E0|nr:flagellar biosynthesis protein FlhF [Teredinibacter waterburyi]
MQTTQNQQVKRFVAPTMRRALDLVRAEMGPEAVILSSQKVPGGVEVITSVDLDLPTRGIDVRREFGQHFDAELDRALASDSAWQQQASVEQAAAHTRARVESNSPSEVKSTRGEKLAMEIERARERMLDAKRRARDAEAPIAAFAGNTETRSQPQHRESESVPPTQAHYSQPAAQSERSSLEQVLQNQLRQAETQASSEVAEQGRLEQLQGEIADMRMLMEQQLWRMNDTSQSHSMPHQIRMPGRFSVLNDHMARLGLPENIAQRLLRDVGHHEKVSHVWRACMNNLAGELPVVAEDMVSKGGIFAFVGQTGVGKTTTIAKLAARYVLEQGPGKVALVTTDTYRVGAFDQLRSLGRILNVPVRAVDTEHSLLTVLASLRQFPLILIDTAGFRHGDPLLKDQLTKLDTCPSLKRILVMACNSQLQTMKASTHAYSSRKGIDACVLSKMDEAASLGEAISVVLERGMPIAYTTDGQEIPKDIALASGRQIVADAVAMLKTSDSASIGAVGN